MGSRVEDSSTVDEKVKETKTEEAEEKPQEAVRGWKGPQWEYHRMRYTETAKYDPTIMDGLGEEGWELVTVYQQFTELNFIFKRPKQ